MAGEWLGCTWYDHTLWTPPTYALHPHFIFFFFLRVVNVVPFFFFRSCSVRGLLPDVFLPVRSRS